MIISVLQVKYLGHREAKVLAQEDTARWCQRLDSNLSLSVYRAHALNK